MQPRDAGSDIVEASRAYEAWVGAQCALVGPDLQQKHARMANTLFEFFRATFYRWMQTWPIACAELAQGPAGRAIGDLHVANFGTWRDSADRLVWGVNDFDEAFPLPYTQDLVRLAASALIAIETGLLSTRPRRACRAILDGYRASRDSGGEPIVLAERHAQLHELVTLKRKDDPSRFWETALQLPRFRGRLPPLVEATIRGALPRGVEAWRVFTRQGGLGSLGRPRYVAIGEWQGGLVGCEVKAVVRSAVAWARGESPTGPVYATRTLAAAIRLPDPHLCVRRPWLSRRFGPQSGRIDLQMMPDRPAADQVLRAMGWETANVHLGNGGCRKSDVPGGSAWLHDAAAVMVESLRKDWRRWQATRGGAQR